MTQEVKPDPSVSVPTESRPPISHDDARKAAQALIDHYFHNPGREAVQCRIPRELTDTDVLLTDYILQQKQLAASSSLLPVGRQKFAVVRYTNYKGQTANRKIVPVRIYFGSTEQHPEEQWLVEAFDLCRNAARTFAMKDMQWNPADTEGLPNRESCDWNHNLCRDCWEWIRPDDVPCAIKPEYASEETCCLCGEKHSSGIYIRRDPKKMPCGKPRSQFALASLPVGESRWISVEEKLPEKFQDVLIWRYGFEGPGEKTWFAVVASLEDDNGSWLDWSSQDISASVVTHWQSLPQPPGPGESRSEKGEYFDLQLMEDALFMAAAVDANSDRAERMRELGERIYKLKPKLTKVGLGESREPLPTAHSTGNPVHK